MNAHRNEDLCKKLISSGHLHMMQRSDCLDCKGK